MCDLSLLPWDRLCSKTGDWVGAVGLAGVPSPLFWGEDQQKGRAGQRTMLPGLLQEGKVLAPGAGREQGRRHQHPWAHRSRRRQVARVRGCRAVSVPLAGSQEAAGAHYADFTIWESR